MKITVVEKQMVTRLKTAKTTKETLKAKGSPTNKDVVELVAQVLDLVADLHEKVVK